MKYWHIPHEGWQNKQFHCERCQVLCKPTVKYSIWEEKRIQHYLEICYLQTEFWHCSSWEAGFAFLRCKKTWSDWTNVFLNLHIALIFSTCRSAGWNNIWFCERESTDLTELQVTLVCFCNEKNFAVWNKPRKHERPQTSLIANGCLSQTAATASHASAPLSATLSQGRLTEVPL